jgi:cytochrome c oxidase assembly protein subunit 15
MLGAYGAEERSAGGIAACRIRRIAFAGALAVLVVIAASAYLRLTAAGLGCEDWPACYGVQAQDARQSHPAVRLVHRVAATVAGVTILAIGVLAFAQARRFRHELRITTALLLLTIGLAALGRATPGSGLPAVALGNVLGGMAMAALLWWLALGPRKAGVEAPARHRALSWAALGLVLAQSALGVLTSASYSGLVCPSLPLCAPDGMPGGWSLAQLDPWSTQTARATLHMLHRLAAFLAVAAVLAVALSRAVRLKVRTILLQLLVVELLLGLLLVALSLPLAAAVAHNVAAALLLLALVAAHHGLAGGESEDRALI